MEENKLSFKELEALRYIRNSLVHHGERPSVRELMNELGYRSPRSAALLIESLILKGFLQRTADNNLKLAKKGEIVNNNAKTIDVPLVGEVACGSPIIAKENIDTYYPVSTELARPPYQYFLLRAKGDSMNQKGINNGDMVLILQKTTANEGEIVVALIDDEATIKELRKSGDTIILLPHSSNKKHRPIILSSDFRIQGVVVKTISGL